MAISQSQKVDFLYKKLGFTKTKTGLSVDGTISGTKKAGFGEALASPLIIADGSVWNQSELIPTTPPGSDSSIVKGYRTANALRMTVDPTVAGNRSYIAYTTFNDTSSARLTNWIDTQFGNDYVLKVYAGDPNSSGTLLPAGGSTGSDSWFFDYSSGVLQFHDVGIHTMINANGTNVYVVGYRYIGQTGVISIGDDTNFGDLTVNNNFRVVGLSTFVDAVNLSNNLSVAGITTLAGLSTVTGHTLFTRQLSVSGVSTFNGALDVNSTSNFGDDVTFQTANSKNVVLDKADNSLKLGDEVKAKFGDSDDLQIWHNANQGRSRINNLTGDFIIQSDSLLLRDYSQGHRYFKAVKDGQVELYYDNEIRFETTGIGVSVLAGTGNTATIAGPQFLILDPDGVGVNTGVVRIKGDLIVDGEQTIIKSTELEIADFIVGIASTATTDALADGAGFKIGPDNTLLYEHNSGTNPSLKSSENLNVATGKVYQIAETERLSASKLSLGTGTTIHAVGTNILSIGTGVAERVRISDDGINVVGISTFSSSIDANGNLDVAGISTFQGLIDANGLIEATAGENKIPSLYANYSNLPNAGSYHGMFAHVHATQKGYFAHGGAWYELVNRKLDGTVGTGTDSYNVGVITATQGDIGNGGLDVDGHTELDNLNVAGISTFTSSIHVTGVGSSVGIGTTNPTQKLEVYDGKILVRNKTDDAAKIILRDDSGSYNHYQIRNEDGTFKIRNSGASPQYDAISVLSTGNIGINSTIPTARLDVNGDTKLQGDLSVTGLSTFTGNIDANGNLDVDGYTELDDLNVSGVSTFAGAIDANGSLDVDGQTELDDLNVAGISTVIGIGTFREDVYIDKKLYVAGIEIGGPGGPGIGTDITTRHLYVSGISTFIGNMHLLSNSSQLKFGTGSGALFVYGDTANGHAYIEHAGAGTFWLRSDTGFRFERYSGGPHEKYAWFNRDSSVDLFYDNGLRFQTSGIGVTVTGQLDTTNIKASGITTTGTLNIGITGHTMVGITTILDEDNMASNSATALATQQSIKTYVDNSSPGGSALAVSADSGSNESINLSSEVLDIEGTSNEIETATGTNKVVIGLPDDVTIGRDLTVTRNLSATGNLTVGAGGTVITTVVGAAASIGIGDASPSYMLDVAGAINSQTDVKVNGVSVTEQALNDAVAMAIALG